MDEDYHLEGHGGHTSPLVAKIGLERPSFMHFSEELPSLGRLLFARARLKDPTGKDHYSECPTQAELVITLHIHTDNDAGSNNGAGLSTQQYRFPEYQLL